MKITLDVPIEIKIEEGGKTIETLKVFYRYPTKKEDKEVEKNIKQIGEIYQKTERLKKKIAGYDKKILYAEEQKKYDKAEKLLNEKEKLISDLEGIEDDVGKKFGSGDAVENQNKKTFETLVSGPGKERLKEIGESISFTKLIRELSKERDEIEKKQSTTSQDISKNKKDAKS